MPLIYGEGGPKAFKRLQEEIMKSSNDQSILLHENEGTLKALAQSPDDFSSRFSFDHNENWRGSGMRTVQNNLAVSLRVCRMGHVAPELFLGIVDSYFRDDASHLHRPAIYLARLSEQEYVRTNYNISRVHYNDDGQIIVTDGSLKRSSAAEHGGMDFKLQSSKIKRSEILLASEPENLLRTRFEDLKPAVIFLQPIINNIRQSEPYEYSQKSRLNQRSPIIAGNGPISLHYRLIACIMLQQSKGHADKIAVLVFLETPWGNSDSWSCEHVIVHLVKISQWAQKEEERDSIDIAWAAAHLGTLPTICEKLGPGPFPEDIIDTIKGEYDPETGASLRPTENAIVRARITEDRFLEDRICRLHVEVQPFSDETRVEPKTQVQHHKIGG
ncbi:hypothetical protein F5Y16DRAFT_417169 [Xylariaceae sp. FL0255]|nr:hypothetical protein F5Y16DRAFT_417169 [Xylariaceae sp. FL0255]